MPVRLESQFDHFYTDFGEICARKFASESAAAVAGSLEFKGLGRFVRAARLNLDLSPLDLAETTGHSEAFIYALEQGMLVPGELNEALLTNLARALKIPPKRLVVLLSPGMLPPVANHKAKRNPWVVFRRLSGPKKFFLLIMLIATVSYVGLSFWLAFQSMTIGQVQVSTGYTLLQMLLREATKYANQPYELFGISVVPIEISVSVFISLLVPLTLLRRKCFVSGASRTEKVVFKSSTPNTRPQDKGKTFSQPKQKNGQPAAASARDEPKSVGGRYISSSLGRGGPPLSSRSPLRIMSFAGSLLKVSGVVTLLMLASLTVLVMLIVNSRFLIGGVANLQPGQVIHQPGSMSSWPSWGNPQPAPTNNQPVRWPKTYPVDPVFKEFYQLLGGADVLGPALAQIEKHNSTDNCQLLERAMLCFNAENTGLKRYYLEPLGSQLNIRPDKRISTGNVPAGARVINGLVIYEKFLPLYDSLYGASYVGEPLTELRINYDLNRVEQFFTNVGFYQSLDNPNGPVFLMPYGAFVCGGACGYASEAYWLTVKANLAEQPFADNILRIGGSSVFGTPELRPEVTADGMLRQVYSNVILQAPLENPDDVSLYSVTTDLGITREPLEARQVHEQLVFFMIDKSSSMGFNVPVPFESYLAVHGGLMIAGEPIQPMKELPDQELYQQCFENLCMIYDPRASYSMKVRLAPLGKEYVKRNTPEAEQLTNFFSVDQINLFVSADHNTLANTEEQAIRIAVNDIPAQQGLARVEGSVTLRVEGRAPIRVYFPPTDVNGMAIAVIPPQPDLAHNTRVQYEVCLNLPTDQPTCRQDSYLIWNNR